MKKSIISSIVIMSVLSTGSACFASESVAPAEDTAIAISDNVAMPLPNASEVTIEKPVDETPISDNVTMPLPSTNEATIEKPVDKMPMAAADLVEDDFSGGTFTYKKSFWPKKGNKINFWVHNKGKTPIIISCTGAGPRTLEAGESGHITSYLNSSSLLFKTIHFKAYANNSNINIHYRIAQRG